MSDNWVKLTPADTGFGECVLVNLSHASSIWRYKEKETQIWFPVQMKNDEHYFYVKETPQEIAIMLKLDKNPS